MDGLHAPVDVAYQFLRHPAVEGCDAVDQRRKPVSRLVYTRAPSHLLFFLLFARSIYP